MGILSSVSLCTFTRAYRTMDFHYGQVLGLGIPPELDACEKQLTVVT